MPVSPKSRKRPWLPERKPQEGRKVKNPFYHSTEWRKFRKMYILMHPLCEQCQSKGIAAPGKVVDHIRPINRENAYDTKNGMYGEPLSFDNVQTLCESCHARKSGRERWEKK